MLGQADEGSGDGDLISKIGSEIEVTIDRWSAGQIGLPDVVAAGVVVLVAVVSAWFVRRLTARSTSHLEGSAATASLVLGQLASAGIYLLAAGFVFEILGFSLGPLIVLVVVGVVVLLFLRPLIQNLSSGLLLQVRGMFQPGEVIETNGTVGVVDEVNTRTVVVVTNHGTTVHIPNNDVLDHVLVNYSRIGRRRSYLTLNLPEGVDVADVTERIRSTVTSAGHVLDDPPPDVVVTGFDGARLCVDVLFWHTPELWAERVARDHVGRALAELFAASELALADTTVVLRPPSTFDGAGAET